VCASDAEGWGQVVVEAASYGLPTLARDVPGLRDSVRSGVTGWLLEDSTHQAVLVDRLTVGLRGALAELDDAGRRAEMRQACRDWAARFTWPAMRLAVQRQVVEELSGPRR